MERDKNPVSILCAPSLYIKLIIDISIDNLVDYFVVQNQVSA